MHTTASAPAPAKDIPLDLLRCPVTHAPLRLEGRALVTADGKYRYDVSAEGIPLFAAGEISGAGRQQQAHYDRVASIYVENLGYPHTQEYMASLDRALTDVVDRGKLGVTAEICCGRGEAFHLFGTDTSLGVGVDVSLQMLQNAVREHASPKLHFVQGDATMLPLADEAFDSVFMLGGIHHVQDRPKLFSEIKRILKPGGKFYFREPLSDFIVWRALRGVVYRLSPALDADTERPLLWEETVPVLERAGLRCTHWSTHGFLGAAVLLNSDVLVVNRLFRFLPGIRALARLAAKLDEKTLALPGFQDFGQQVVGVAERPRFRGSAAAATTG